MLCRQEIYIFARKHYIACMLNWGFLIIPAFILTTITSESGNHFTLNCKIKVSALELNELIGCTVVFRHGTTVLTDIMKYFSSNPLLGCFRSLTYSQTPNTRRAAKAAKRSAPRVTSPAWETATMAWASARVMFITDAPYPASVGHAEAMKPMAASSDK